MKWLLPYLFALALPVLAQTGSAQVDGDRVTEPNVAGTVDLIEGEVRVFDADKKRRSVTKGDRIYEAESIVTGRDGEVHLSMEDGGFIGIRPGTRMRFTRYQAYGESTDTVVIGLLKGAMRSVTGWIGKYNASNYQIRTPTATIGIRGTDHETLVIPPGQGDGEPGTYDKVNIGGTTLQAKQGKVEVEPNRAGFVPHGVGGPPRILSQVPRFFKPTRHEAAFQGRHETIHRAIDQHRDEKRKSRQEKTARQQVLDKEKPGRHPDKPGGQVKKQDKPQAPDANQRREMREAERQKRLQKHKQAAAERKRQHEEGRKADKEHRKQQAHQRKPGE